MGGVAKDEIMKNDFTCTACGDVWENDFRCNMFGTRCKNCCPCAYGVTSPNSDGTCSATKASVLTDAQTEAAHRWYIAHYQHVNRLIDSMDDKLATCPPTDKSSPELWKAAHWNWFLNPANTTK